MKANTPFIEDSGLDYGLGYTDEDEKNQLDVAMAALAEIIFEPDQEPDPDPI